MKSVKKLVFVALAIGVVCGVAAVLVVRREAAQQAALQREKARREADSEQARNQAAPAEEPLTQVTEAPPPAEPAPPAEAAPIEIPPKETAPVAAPAKKAVKTAAQPNPAPRPPKAPLQDPLARDALCLVGFDPEAEQYWVAAINDPSLSSHERQDLIEDLNEEGFLDPKNLTADDLPLIMSRIALIEQHAADAMDDVNAAAFMEAYKDLWNMYARAAGW